MKKPGRGAQAGGLGLHEADVALTAFCVIPRSVAVRLYGRFIAPVAHAKDDGVAVATHIE